MSKLVVTITDDQGEVYVSVEGDEQGMWRETDDKEVVASDDAAFAGPDDGIRSTHMGELVRDARKYFDANAITTTTEDDK